MKKKYYFIILFLICLLSLSVLVFPDWHFAFIDSFFKNYPYRFKSSVKIIIICLSIAYFPTSVAYLFASLLIKKFGAAKMYKKLF